MIEDIYNDTKDKMNKSIEALKTELAKIRTGRASLSMFDGIKADYYGAATPINQIASIAVPESRLVTIQPWDAAAIKEIEKAILKSDLGLTPSNDGKIIRLAIPPLTEQRRKEIVKTVNKVCENYKVAIRNIRRDANDLLKKLKKEGEIAEDQAFKSQDDVQKITDDYIKKIDAVYKEKEAEVLEI
ncbi:MAG: ribosome recycling factor [Deltaproteobacteria bacterium]|nr:ribosome recycling factor [Deltaproteobacteria bacterium]